MILRLALRNLARNRWRSGLTIGGIAVATFMVIWTGNMMDAMLDHMVAGATSAEIGHIQIHSKPWVDEHSIFYTMPRDQELLDELRAVPGVAGVSARIQATGLIGHEKRSQVARLLGVDPTHEAETTTVEDGIQKGRWLFEDPAPKARPREVVLGSILAKQLSVAIGDELVVFLQDARGGLGNDLLEVVGIVRTGNSAIDRSAAYLHIDDAEFLMALEGQAHEISITLDNIRDLDRAATEVRRIVSKRSDPKLVAQTWKELVPEMAGMVEVSKSSSWLLYAIIYFIAGLGILNTQRMSALERRREFGVLMAIGTTPGRVGAQLVAETVVITFVGAVVGAIFGVALSLYHGEFGFDMTGGSGGDGFTYLGVSFADRLYFDTTVASVVQPFVVLLALALVCGLWPAIKSARIDPTRAIAGRG